MYSCYIKIHGALSISVKIFKLSKTLILSKLHYHYIYKTGKAHQKSMPHIQDGCEYAQARLNIVFFLIQI